MSLDPQFSGGDRAVIKLFGAFLMAVGGLIVLLCGLCSLGVVGAMITGVVQAGFAHHANLGSSSIVIASLATTIAMVAIFGGVPGLCGLAVFLWGRNLYRRRPGRE